MLRLSQVGKKVREARLSLSLSQDQVRKMIEVSRCAYVNLELGRRHLKFDKMMTLAKILRIPPKDITDAR